MSGTATSDDMFTDSANLTLRAGDDAARDKQWPGWTVFVIAPAVVCFSSTTLLMAQASQTSSHHFGYSVPFLILLTCLAKAAFSALWLAVQLVWDAKTSPTARAIELPLTAKLLFATGSCAVLTVSAELLLFANLNFFPASSIAVLSTLKLAASALCGGVFLRKRVTDVQYVACALLVLGVAIALHGFCDGSHGSYVAGAGYPLFLLSEAVAVSAHFANGAMLKDLAAVPIAFQQFVLALSSIVLLIPILLIADRNHLTENGVLRNFSPMLFGLLIINAVSARDASKRQFLVIRAASRTLDGVVVQTESAQGAVLLGDGCR